MRTIASYAAWSPCGWNLPSTSPTTRALFTGLALGARPISLMAKRIRRCTGFWPSQTSGSARPLTTETA